MATGSPQTAWENIIKEYNVSGDNVAHYNLLDLNVDARDLEGLARLLEQMK